MQNRILIDTDPGVDDAWAILMAYAHPQTEVEAIFTVAGNVGLDHTTLNACRIVDLAGANTPVYAGCERALVFSGDDAAYVHGGDGLGDAGLASSSRKVEAEHAAVELVRRVNAEPGELSLIALGPLTNIALALHLDPHLPHKIKRFVVMGGAVTARGNVPDMVSAEFNFYADPEAAHIVFEGWQRCGVYVELSDWEVTVRYRVDQEIISQWCQIDTPNGRFIRDIYANFLDRLEKMYGHRHLALADPLAMAVLLEPDIVTRAELRPLMIETQGSTSRGQSTVNWQPRADHTPGANASIVLDVDQKRFQNLVVQALS